MGNLQADSWGDILSPHREEEIRLLNRQLMVRHSSESESVRFIKRTRPALEEGCKISEGDGRKTLGEEWHRGSLLFQALVQSNRKGKGRKEGVGGLFFFLLLASNVLTLQQASKNESPISASDQLPPTSKITSFHC